VPFPNLKDKHLKDSLVTPQDFIDWAVKTGKYGKFTPPEGVIFCYSSRLLNTILESEKTEKVDFGDLYLLKRGHIGVMKLGIGAPVAAAMMEELIALGVKKFLSIGEAGSLQPNLKVGDIILCDQAIRDEGVSHHYLKHAKYVDSPQNFLKEVESVVQSKGIAYTKGTTWTIDAPYRETGAEVEQYQKEGVLTVEMEAAALFAVAQYRGVDVASLFTVSDHLGELEWEPKFHLTTEHFGTLFGIAKAVFERDRRSLKVPTQPRKRFI